MQNSSVASVRKARSLGTFAEPAPEPEAQEPAPREPGPLCHKIVIIPIYYDSVPRTDAHMRCNAMARHGAPAHGHALRACFSRA